MKIAGRRPIHGQRGNTQTLESLIVESAAAVRPPERLTVSEAAAKYRYLNNPGAYVGPWLNETTPYLIEPMNTLTSMDYSAVVFVGSAQMGKTELILNWAAYSAVCDPADFMIVQTSNTSARDFSIRRLDRLHRQSKEVGKRLVPGKAADNVFDKHYRSGMLLTLSWPTINELSGKPIPRQALTDYDRMVQNIDGEGTPFALTQARGTTFKRFAMTLAESTPGFPVSNPKWIRKTKHEAPPTEGILALYNAGDRRRYYWRCVECENAFEPSFELLDYPDSEDFLEAAEAATMLCPHCNHRYYHDQNDHGPSKAELNQAGRWIKDGQVWTPEGTIVGQAARSSTASFWLKGAAAAFSNWKELVEKYLNAEAEYERTGSEGSLIATVNTNQGEPYIPKSSVSDRVPEVLKSRARDVGIRVVPPMVRFLVAAIDVQKNRFVVQVHGIAANNDIYVVDRFDIRKSKRVDEDGERKWVNPGAYPEDWKLVAEEVIQKSYPLSDGSGREMAVKLTLCDSGGREGVTQNAYNFFRWLRNGDGDGETDDDGETSGPNSEEGSYLWKPGMAGRFILLKGASTKGAPRVALSYPDSQRKDRHAGARGEIPVLFINTDMVKDMVDHRLDRVDPGGRFVFPNWLDDNFYTELTVEVRDKTKGWVNPKRYRNESWDLLAYCLAGTLTSAIALDRLDLFGEPPTWAAEWDENDMVFNPASAEKPFEAAKKKTKTLAEIAGELA